MWRIFLSVLYVTQHSCWLHVKKEMRSVIFVFHVLPLDSLSSITLGNCNPRDRYDREQSLMTALPSLSAREKIMTRVKDDIVPLKEAFKWSVQGLIATELGGVSVATRVTLRNSQSLRLPQLLIMFTFIFASTFGTLEWWVNTDVLMVWVEMETMLKTNAIHL